MVTRAAIGDRDLPTKSIKAWSIVGFLGYLLFPWFSQSEGFWSFEWIEYYPIDEIAGPAIIEALKFNQNHLWIVLAMLVLPMAGCYLTKSRKYVANLFVGAAIVGGLVPFIHHALYSASDSIGFGYGALLVCCTFLAYLAQGLAAHGLIRGDNFIMGSIVFMLALITVFVFYPVSKVLLNAFIDPAGHLAIGNFFKAIFAADIWHLNYFWGEKSFGVAWNSVFLASATGIGTTILGLVFALLITRTGIKLKKIVKMISIFPIITPPFVLGLSVILLFGNSGAITHFLHEYMGIPPTRWVYGFTGVWLAQLFAFTPIAFLVLVGIVEGIGPSLEEAAQTLRANRLRTFYTVTLPLIKPGLANAFLLGFIESLADFGNPLVLGGNFDVLATEIYFSIAGAQSDATRAAVLSIILLSFSIAAFYIQRRWLGNKSYTTVSGKGDAGLYSELPVGIKYAIYTIGFPWLLISLVLYGTIFFGGFVKIWGLDHTFTLTHYLTAFRVEWGNNGIVWSGSAWNSFWTTLKIAAISAPITAILGITTGYILSRQKFKGLYLFEFLTMLTFAIPGTVIGVSYILSFNVPPIEITGTGIILVVCFIFRNMPVSIRSTIASLSQIDKSLDESSLTLGANSFMTLRKVILPLLRPAIISSLVYGFVRAMTSLSAIIFLVSANYDLSTTFIVGLVENGDYGVAIAYSSVLIFIMIGVIGSIQFLVGDRNIGRRKK